MSKDVKNSAQWITFKWCFWRQAFQESLSKTTTSHIHPINKVNLTELERNCLAWTNLDRALWSNGWCFSATASPLHLSVGGCDILIGFTVKLWSARCSVLGVICISLFGTAAFPQGKYSGLAFFNSGVYTFAQIQDIFSLVCIAGFCLHSKHFIFSFAMAIFVYR